LNFGIRLAPNNRFSDDRAAGWYKTIVERMRDGILILSDDKIVFANNALAELLGYKPERMVGKSFADIVPPECRELLMRQHARRNAGLPVPDYSEFSLLHANRAAPIKSFATAANLPNTPDGPLLLVTVLVYPDVQRAETSVSRADPDFDGIVRNFADVFYRTDKDGVIIEISSSCENHIGYSRQEMLGQRLSNFYADPAERDRVITHMTAQGGEITPIEARMIHKDGSTIWASSNSFFRRDADGNVIGVEGVARNVTDQKTIEIQLREREVNLLRTRELLVQAKTEADLANQSKTMFLANVSHEFRTPLNAILGFSEVIQRQHFGPVDDRYRSYAGDIHHSGRLLLNIIDNVMDLSKVEVGALVLEESEFDLRAAIKDCLYLLKHAADAVGHSMEFLSTAQERGPIISGDETKIKQVFINLLSNAVKFTEPGGEITVHMETSPGGGLVCVVSDNGRGIPTDEIPRILHPFERIANEATRANEGSGLGLALTKSLCDAHRATLAIHSALGQGTRVNVGFPPDRVRVE
jgi:PAS domain S-box-containing protein